MLNNDKTVLIADDSPFIRNSLRLLLEQNGYEVVALAENGVDAVARFTQLRPALVLLDLIMPKMDGPGALRTITQIDPNAKVVVVSSISTRASVLECLKLGAKNYILKPFEPQKILDTLARVMAGRSATAPMSIH